MKGSLATYVRSFDRVVRSTFRSCDACDFAFMANPFDAATMNAYYSNNEQYRPLSLTAEEKSHIAGQIAFLKPRVSHLGRPSVLEIGANVGEFLGMAAKRLAARTFFLEYNKDAQRALKARGHRPDRRGTVYDVIVMRHVFEHIVDPVGYLKGLAKRLAPGGVVFAEVPDYTARHLAQSDYFMLEHVNYFSQVTFSAAARRAGLVVTAVEFARTPGYSTTPNRVIRVAMTRPVREPGRKGNDGRWDTLMRVTVGRFMAVDAFIRSRPGRRFAFYAAGTMTRMYFANARRAPANLLIFDKDPKKIGTSLFGRPILDPRSLDPSSFDNIFPMVVGDLKAVRETLRNLGVPMSKIVEVDALID